VNEVRQPDRRLDGLDPWARGGAMSDPEHWMPTDDRVAAEVAPARRMSGGRRLGRSRGPLVIGGVVVVLVLVVAGWRGLDDRAANKRERAGAADPTEAAPELLVDRVRWTRVSGDAASLPAEVIAMTGSQFVGRDDGGAVSWSSVDGVTWSKDQSVGVTEE